MCGNKPAKDFTPHERGQVKVTYCRRKVVWDKAAELVRAGFTADEAIDKIYRAYGERLSVSAILTKVNVICGLKRSHGLNRSHGLKRSQGHQHI